MQKILLLLGAIVLLTGCTVSQGNYKAGTYYGYAEDTYGGANNIASAVVYVDNSGSIKSIFLDTTYTTKDGKVTTKKTLGNNYGMKNVSASKGTIAGGAEWFEQVNNLEKKVVEQQNLDFIKWTDDSKSTTDSVTGVTIKIDALYKALDNALKQAK